MAKSLFSRKGCSPLVYQPKVKVGTPCHSLPTPGKPGAAMGPGKPLSCKLAPLEGVQPHSTLV